MKNVLHKFLSIVGITAVIFMTSCGSDDSGPTAALPSLTVSATLGDGTTALANGGDVIAGESVVFTINATAPGGFNTLDVSGSITDQIDRNELGLEAGTTSTGDFTLTTTTTEANIGGTAVVDFVVVDELSQLSDTVTFSFTVVGIPAKVVSQLLLAPPLGNNSSLTFYSIGFDTRYSHADVTGTADPVSETIDLGYYYGTTDLASLAAPSAYPASVFDISAWTTRKATPLWSTDMTSEDWIGLTTTADVSTAWAASTTAAPENVLTDLAVGDIIAFQTDDTELLRGFIMVVAISGTDGEGDSIELEIILDQPAE